MWGGLYRRFSILVKCGYHACEFVGRVFEGLLSDIAVSLPIHCGKAPVEFEASPLVRYQDKGRPRKMERFLL